MKILSLILFLGLLICQLEGLAEASKKSLMKADSSMSLKTDKERSGAKVAEAEDEEDEDDDDDDDDEDEDDRNKKETIGTLSSDIENVVAGVKRLDQTPQQKEISRGSAMLDLRANGDANADDAEDENGDSEETNDIAPPKERHHLVLQQDNVQQLPWMTGKKGWTDEKKEEPPKADTKASVPTVKPVWMKSMEAVSAQEDSSEKAADKADSSEKAVDKVVAARPPAPVLPAAPSPAHMAAPSYANEHTNEKIEMLEKELAQNLRMQAKHKAKMSVLLDKEKSDANIESMTAAVSKETESSALGNVLAKMWKDMRRFEVPMYKKQAAEETLRLKREEKVLEQKLVAEQAKLSGKQELKREKESPPSITKTAKEQVHKPLEQADSWGGNYYNEHIHPNYWTVTPENQTIILGRSLAYLCLGVLSAILYRLFIRKSPAFQPHKPSKQPHTLANAFTFGLFGCFEDLGVCFMACACPCLRWADTLERTTLSSFGKAFVMMFFLYLLDPYTAGISWFGVILLGLYYRQRLRDHYGIENGTGTSVLHDCLVWTCCQPCAIIQEAREEVANRQLSGP
jgi:Cys-rich protein (TIGR01571 family)